MDIVIGPKQLASDDVLSNVIFLAKHSNQNLGQANSEHESKCTEAIRHVHHASRPLPNSNKASMLRLSTTYVFSFFVIVTDSIYLIRIEFLGLHPYASSQGQLYPSYFSKTIYSCLVWGCR